MNESAAEIAGMDVALVHPGVVAFRAACVKFVASTAALTAVMALVANLH